MQRPEPPTGQRGQRLLVWGTVGLLGLALLTQLALRSDRSTPRAQLRAIAPGVPPLPPETVGRTTTPRTPRPHIPHPRHSTRDGPAQARASGRLPPPTPRATVATSPGPARPPDHPTPTRTPRPRDAAGTGPRQAAPPPVRYGPVRHQALPLLEPIEALGRTIRGRCIVFVVDQSSSMIRLMPALKRALGHALSQLTRYHRFNVLFFDDRMHSFRGSMVRGTRTNLRAAWAWIQPRKAGGNTRAMRALRTAIAFEEARVVVLLTDGALSDGEYRYLLDYVGLRTRAPEVARRTPCLRLVPLNPEIGRDPKLQRLQRAIRRQPERSNP